MEQINYQTFKQHAAHMKNKHPDFINVKKK